MTLYTLKAMSGAKGKILTPLILSLLCAMTAAAQDPVAITPFQLLDARSGQAIPCVGCSIYTYAAGTNTPLAVYTDYTVATPNTNPVLTNSSGYAVSGATVTGIWVGSSCYKFIAKDASAVTIWTQDHICDQAAVLKALLAGATGANQIGFEPTGGNILTSVGAALNSAFLYDVGFSTAAAACASSKTVAVTSSALWENLSTATCGAILWFPAGTGFSGIQPSSGQTITLTNCPIAGNYKIFSLSAGGSIAFSGGCSQPPPIQWWGGVADGSTDNLAAANAATSTLQAAGIPLFFPPSPSCYAFSANWTPLSTTAKQGWEIFGNIGLDPSGTTRGSCLTFAAGGINLAAVNLLTVHDLQIIVGASGGPNIKLTGLTAETTLRNLTLTSSNPAQSLVRGLPGGGGDIDLVLLDCIDYFPAAAYSAAPVWFTNDAGNSALNPGTISGCGNRQLHGSLMATAPFIRVDCGAFAGCSGWTVEHILCEAAPAGCVEFDGITNSEIRDTGTADSGTTTAPSVLLKASAGGPSNNITMTSNNLQEGAASLTHPSLLVDQTAFPFAAQVTAIGGNIAYTRLKAMSAAAPAFINVRFADYVGHYNLTTDNSFGFGGILLNASSGTGAMTLSQNPSGQFFATFGGCLAAADLVIDSSDPNLVSSGTHNFVGGDVGGYIDVTGGTGFVVDRYQIVAVGANKAYLLTSPGAVGSTGGSYDLNRGRIAYIQSGAGSNDIWNRCSKDNADVYAWRGW